MQPKLIMTPLGQYEPVKWNGENASGCQPFGDRILVLPDGAAEQTTGNVFIPEGMQERMSMAAESGVLIAMGDTAFTRNFDRTGPWTGKRPEIGQRIGFERYAGSIRHGKDGRLYRVMDDKCISDYELPTPKKLRAVTD